MVNYQDGNGEALRGVASSPDQILPVSCSMAGMLAVDKMTGDSEATPPVVRDDVVRAGAAASSAGDTIKTPQKAEGKSISNDSLLKLINDYSENPTRDKYLTLFESIAVSSSYNPYYGEMLEIDNCLKKKKYSDAEDLMKRIATIRFTSPEYHLKRSFILKELNDTLGWHRESKLSELLLTEILASGKGTEELPYEVLWIDDEYVVLSNFGKTLKMQSSISEGDREFDRMDCRDGSVLWFDTTNMSRAFMKKLKGIR
jgi:hypothetical protein